MRHLRPLLFLASLGVLAGCQDRVTGSAPEQPRPSAQPAVREGYTTPGERRTGWIINRYGKPSQVTYEVHDGRAIFERDIDLGPAEQIPTTEAGLLPAGDARKGVYIDGSGYRWPDGYVYYTISSSFTPTEQQGILDGMAHIHSNNPGVTFAPRTSQSNYVNFTVSTTGCSSQVGKRGGKQDINLTGGCAASPGIVAHEAMHALGMWHEQSRCDRDTYVTILTSNIEPGKEHNFDKECSGATDVFSYDEGSIMHYASNDFGIGGATTIQSKRGLAYLMGQRTAMSSTDVSTVHWLYAPPFPSFSATYPGGVPTLAWGAPATATSYDLYYVVDEYYNHVYNGSWSNVNEYPIFTGSSSTSWAGTVPEYTGCSYYYDYSDPYADHQFYYSYKVVAHFPSGATRAAVIGAEVGNCN